jgi:hypothetical protein
MVAVSVGCILSHGGPRAHLRSVSAFLFLLFLNLNSLVLGGSAVEFGHSIENDFGGRCDNAEDSLISQRNLWQKHRDSCAYNTWFSTADESLVVADQLSRPLVKLQGYGFHEDVAWSIGCAWCSSAAAPVVASGGWDGALMWWNASTGAFLFKQSFSNGILTAISGHQTVTPPPSILLVSSWKGSILAILPCSGDGPSNASERDIGIKPVVLWTAAASSAPLHSVCLCSDMGFAGGNDGTATSVRLLDGKILTQIRISSEPLWSMACTSGREHRLVAASGKQRISCCCVRELCMRLCFSCAGDGSVYILSASLESVMALQRSVTLQPQLPLYSITLVDENRMFVGSRGGFVAGIHCSLNGCLQYCGADLKLGAPVRALSHTTCR